MILKFKYLKLLVIALTLFFFLGKVSANNSKLLYQKQKADSISFSDSLLNIEYFTYMNEHIVFHHEKNVNYSDRILKFYESSHLNVKILLWLVGYFFLSVLVLILIILIHRMRDISRTKCSDMLKERYSELVTSLVFDDNPTIDLPSLNSELLNSFNFDVFLNVLEDLQMNISGEYGEKIKSVFNNTELKQQTLLRLKSKKWHIRAKGIRSAVLMNFVEVEELIANMVNDPLMIIQTESELAAVQLDKKNPMSFLSKLVTPLSDWEQLTIIDTIKRHNIYIYSLAQWLKSKNKTVVVFVLRLIAMLKQTDATPKVMELIDSQDEQIRFECINCLGQFLNPESTIKLKKIFVDETVENKMGILDALSKSNDVKNISFYNEVMNSEKNYNVLIKTAKALNSIEDEGQKLLLLISTQNKALIPIINHAKDSRI